MKFGRGRAIDLAAVALAIGAALWVYRSVPHAFFSPDDLIYLERVRGIVAQPPGPWRWLSGIAYFQIASALFGAEPMPYMIVQLALHALAIAALYATVRGLGGGVLGAGAAAVLFGASRVHYPALAQAVTVAEPMSVLLALAALAVARRPGAGATLAALALFTAALLAKESVAALPLLLLVPGIGPGAWRARAIRCGLLLAPALLLALYMASPGVHAAIFVNQVYGRAYGMHLVHNLATLTRWTYDFRAPAPDLNGELSTSAWPGALALLAALAALAAAAWRTTPAPALGLAWFALTLAPVLPLLHQRYLHYLYVPAFGLAAAIGAGAEWLLLRAFAPARRDVAARVAPVVRGLDARTVMAWALVAGALAAFVAVSDALIVQRRSERLPSIDLPSDPFVRKMETARRAITAVRGAIGRATGPRVNAVIVIPASGWTLRLAGILHSVLGEGRALRATVPALDSVALVPRWTPAWREFELFYGSVDGNFVDLGRGPEAHADLGARLIADRCVLDARAELAAARAQWPDDAKLRAESERLESALAGRSAGR
ncbi:MAG: hypothetical protein HY076_08680 [Candidatus Eisenbacteria bacterium]|uniref:Uncharacterized protein n=1 Tax=Eiseniibacteriota bacterium TaxID=2212470 RepID=A0A9D6L830_UNCEI|nr:hypothetical protein [Candidatus Eisenbacteria bacterium]MBI3540331.1 hypothetical protein [Candidatus Eisenbacteria bacterium]